MIQYALHNASYLDAAKHYYKVWETPTIKAETEGRGRTVGYTSIPLKQSLANLVTDAGAHHLLRRACLAQ